MLSTWIAKNSYDWNVVDRVEYRTFNTSFVLSCCQTYIQLYVVHTNQMRLSLVLTSGLLFVTWVYHFLCTQLLIGNNIIIITEIIYFCYYLTQLLVDLLVSVSSLVKHISTNGLLYERLLEKFSFLRHTIS